MVSKKDCRITGSSGTTVSEHGKTIDSLFLCPLSSIVEPLFCNQQTWERYLQGAPFSNAVLA